MAKVVLQPTKCTGCRVCEAICSVTKEAEFNPVKSRIRVVRMVERSILYSIPVFCLQCEEAHCQVVCPVRAIKRNSKGVLLVDEKTCIGCRMCEIVCPVGAITVNPEKHVAIKCNLCAELGEPQCVKYCYPGALQYLPDERVGIALARAKSEKFLEMAKKEAA